MIYSKTKGENADEELEAYISLKCREIAREGHCAVCECTDQLCREKIRKTATRIHTLVSEAILYHGGGEDLPEIE